MIEVKISDSVLQQAASEGMDAFLKAVVDAINDSIGGSLTAETMPQLNASQITLLGYNILREEVMDGGFVQMIHNGYGPFFFKNPFGVAMREWGLPDLKGLLNRAQKLYERYHAEIEQDCSDEEFMAMFERYPAFDDLDDQFVENEEHWTAIVACYVDEHLADFVTIV